MRKMKHDQNKINLSPFLFPMSLFLPFATLSKPILLTLVCLNATEVFD